MQTVRLAEGCVRCPDLVANRRCIVHGYGPNPSRSDTAGRRGPASANVLFIGEAPGYRGGDLTGVPFSRDRSGVRLQQALIDLELSQETDPHVERPRLGCFVTNVVRCNPPGNRTPTRAEITNCLPYLWREIELLQPEIVVPVGSVATGAVFARLLEQPAPPITRAHARVYLAEGIRVVPLRHPSRISNADLARFVAVMRGVLA